MWESQFRISWSELWASSVKDMIDFSLSFLDVSEIDDSILLKHYYIMDETRKDETRALVSDIKKRQKIAADMLCRQMISEKCSLPEESIEFRRNSFGKLFAANADVFFSISHSGNIVLCAVSDKEIGADIEKIRNIRFDAAKKFAGASELEYIGENLNRFFEIWTLKEAFFKCKGTGLGADIGSVSFSVKNGDVSCSEKGYNLYIPQITDGFICSVCIKD